MVDEITLASREFRKRLKAGCVERYEVDIAEIESRDFEPPRMPQDDIDKVKLDIDSARVERQRIRSELIALRTTKGQARDLLVAQREAAVGAQAKAVIKAQIDSVNDEITSLRDQLKELDEKLEMLVEAKKDLLWRERHAKGSLLPEDMTRLEQEKEAQRQERAIRREFLQKHGK